MAETRLHDSDTDRADAEARAEAAALRAANLSADPATLRMILTGARTPTRWTDRPVSEDLLRRVWDLARMGPTSMNAQPLRIVFVTTEAGKDRLEPCVVRGNRAKIRAAPVTAILAHDLGFAETLPRLFPHAPKAADMFRADPALAEATAFRNATLQGAYLIVAARALGLDAGPMSGFDNAAVDAAFFAGTALRSNFLCCLGYGDPGALFRRLPRLSFDEACRIV